MTNKKLAKFILVLTLKFRIVTSALGGLKCQARVIRVLSLLLVSGLNQVVSQN